MLAPAKPALNPGEFSKFVEYVRKGGGYFSLLLQPPSCPKGFACFFAHVPFESERDAPTRTVASIELTAKDLRSPLIYDRRAPSVPLNLVDGRLLERVQHFDEVVGGSKLFWGGLHIQILIADTERPHHVKDAPDLCKFAVGRIYQEFAPSLESEKQNKEFPYRSRIALQNLLCRIMAPGAR